MRWVMEYRTRVYSEDTWGEWNTLPSTLIFTDIYLPRCWEFRAVPLDPTSGFVFDGEHN